jgi:purine-binding chemotaxis protein CheW
MGEPGVTATARPPAGERPAERLKLVCFYLHGQEYAAPITTVKEMIALRPITRVFLTPPWLAGLINLRGDVVAVIDVGRFLGMPPSEPGDESRIVVLRHGGRSAGIIVDRMAELRTIDAAALQPPPTTLSAGGAAMIDGIATVDGGKAVRVLDVASLFESDQVRAFQRGGA